jgi:hypothetical protein
MRKTMAFKRHGCRLRQLESIPVEQKYFPKPPSMLEHTRNSDNKSRSLRPRYAAQEFIRNEFLGFDLLLEQQLSDKALECFVCCGRYLLLTAGFVPLSVIREVVSLCIRNFRQSLTISGKHPCILERRSPTWLLAASRETNSAEETKSVSDRGLGGAVFGPEHRFAYQSSGRVDRHGRHSSDSEFSDGSEDPDYSDFYFK